MTTKRTQSAFGAVADSCAEISLDHPTGVGENGLSHRISLIQRTWAILPLGDHDMKQISVYDFYTFGKALRPLFDIEPTALRTDAAWDILAAHEQLLQAVRPESILLPASQSAAAAVTKTIERLFAHEVAEWYPGGKEGETIGAYKADQIKAAAKDFDTIFEADSPSMTVFATSQKGIYDTRSLILRANDHLPQNLRAYLSDQARTDIAAAGKCLAFEVSTASAFHTWRALETVMGSYYTVLTGETFESAKVGRNWFKYKDALVGAGADSKITGNLDHIRAEYRNPVMHPNVNVDLDEAFSLFGVGISAITQVLQAIARHTAPKP